MSKTEHLCPHCVKNLDFSFINKGMRHLEYNGSHSFQTISFPCSTCGKNIDFKEEKSTYYVHTNKEFKDIGMR